jgi:D-serine deaminase-like pyridoxal phosphate-dependent protein
VHATRLSDIETPAVVVDRERLLANLDRVGGIARHHGLRLRPHVKTHKCLEIARLQLERGAVGITASKVDEALVFIANGVRSVTVAYPLVDPRKVHRLLAAAREHGSDVRVTVDSRAGIEVLAQAATESGVAVGVFLEIDVGLQRCGLRKDAPELVQLARLIVSSRDLRFLGLLSHAGHAYGAADRSGVEAIAAEECAILQRVRSTLESAGIEVAEVSVGSTPTVLASVDYEGITEIRPGNYVFLDRTPVRLGLATLDQVAMTVITTVVSRNDAFLITDAGSKVLSSDLGAHGTAGVAGYGLAFPPEFRPSEAPGFNVAKLSEEHGFVERTADIPVGARLRIVPNHACPVVNLSDELLVVSGDKVLERWPVAARGRVA